MWKSVLRDRMEKTHTMFAKIALKNVLIAVDLIMKHNVLNVILDTTYKVQDVSTDVQLTSTEIQEINVVKVR